MNGHPGHPSHFVSSALLLVEDPNRHPNEMCILLASDMVRR